jgi:CNT family concentrative nucleoside transporter
MDSYNLLSLAGIPALLLVAWWFSADRRRLNGRLIFWGVGLQLALAAIVFRAPGSTRAMLAVNDGVLALLEAAQAGQVFVFGPLATGDFLVPDGGSTFILAAQGLPMVIFFAALMGLLYHWGVMSAVVRGFSWLFTRLMRISGAESLCAASNIFVGIESATTVRPYLGQMTRSELCTILTAGMATVASTTLGIYVLALKDTFPTIAGHLITASILSAPAAIVMAKILVPETGEPLTLGRTVPPAEERAGGAIDAIIRGAMAGVKLLVGIVALLIAFLGLIALADLILGGVAGWLGLSLSLTRILGWILYPFAVVIGVPPADAALAGTLLGERLIVTEIPAYIHLAASLEANAFAHPRSPVVIAYALCGFAHVASLAIFVGGIAALVPERRADLAKVGPRALLAATLACLMTGAVAGTFFHAAHNAIVTGP